VPQSRARDRWSVKLPQPLVIIGTGGSAYDILDVVDAINEQSPTWVVAGFLDDQRPAGSSCLGFEVLGALADARFLSGDHGRGLSDAAFINSIGSDRTYLRRRALIERCGLPEERFATLIHPLAGVSPRARFGRGVCVNYGVSVAGNVTVGNHVWLGPASIVGHDSILDNYSLLAPGAVVSGLVHVGDSCYIGAGAQIRHQIVIGAGSLVGMAAVVVKDVAPGDVVVGNPARKLRAAATTVELEYPPRRA
jgi:sugar O-acyltransferase (sialic acid O-acetyltransferase NeuD family)